MVFSKSWPHYRLAGTGNVMTVPTYGYQPLEDESSIRVLVLEPASVHSAPLVATLHNIRIAYQDPNSKETDQQKPNSLLSSNAIPESKLPQYEAVSYAWGDQQPTLSLEILGAAAAGPIAIRPNVDTMLRYLRPRDKPRRLWIDALCINQEDTREQAAQVQHMGEVYRYAQAVVIWIGPPATEYARIDLFFDNLVKYADNQDTKMSKDTWQILRAILEENWFNRRWIIQEALLAKQATMCCGNHSIDFMAFAKSAWLFAQRQPHHMNVPLGIVRKLWMMYKLRLALVPELRSDILSLMIEFSTAQCRNDLDRIYALNALTGIQMKVAYDVPVETVYKRYAEMHVGLGNLAILNCGGAFRSTASIPSWVPDWRSFPGYIPLATKVVPERHEQQMAAASFDESSGRSVFSVNGIKLGTVTRVGSGASFPTWSGDLLHLLQDWYSFFDRNASKGSRRPASKEKLGNQFIATVTLGAVAKRVNALSPGHPYLFDAHSEQSPDVTSVLAHLIHEARLTHGSDSKILKDKNGNQATASKSLESLNDALKNLTYGSPTSRFDLRYDANSLWGSADHPLSNEDPYARNLQPSEFAEIMCRTVAGRTCFWSSDGSFGLSPANMETGDVIVAIPTCPTPYVLRPKSAKSPIKWLKGLSSPSDDEYYKLVGDCYVHDFEPEEVFGNGKDLRRLQIV
ncbi:HET-domain-containing protein [Ophiobolus disseminans]|uniref:HET-domain-containing protein n=1 Tax=Ophiobolus disseminans TaxID=1469910 RepID=A0A6A6ZXE6_9PLEO|nr:HET-domain-containing protein [Ophiobolus disseminans]